MKKSAFDIDFTPGPELWCQRGGWCAYEHEMGWPCVHEMGLEYERRGFMMRVWLMIDAYRTLRRRNRAILRSERAADDSR